MRIIGTVYNAFCYTRKLERCSLSVSRMIDADCMSAYCKLYRPSGLIAHFTARALPLSYYITLHSNYLEWPK